MHFIVTGGAGFIGSHLVEKLLNLGHHVTVIDNFSTGKAENLPASNKSLRIIELDIRSPENVFSIQGQFDGIFHLAALVSVPESIENPQKSFEINSCGTFYVLELARKLHIPRFVFVSSAAVYGNTEKIPVSEDDPLNPLSPYGLEKMHGELLCKMYSGIFGFKARAARFFNVYGPRQDPSSPYSGVISIFARRLFSGQEAVIYGDGLQTRDFIFVSDVADCLINFMLDAKTPNDVYNVGTGKSITLADLYKTICEILHIELNPRFQDARPGDIRHSRADISRIQKDFSFQPKYSIKDGLIELIKHIR